jgi:16S rRNA (cytosine967-C5)-methyltransferase
MRSHSYLNTTKKIIDAFDGSIPLASWLKQFFKSDKKFGSKDRKEISHACYCFYRLGNALKDLDIEERILAALFLCSNSSNKILEELKPDWNKNVSLPINKKIGFVSAQDELKRIFPFSDEISREVHQEQFNLSFLIQPDLYLRIRTDNIERVTQQLQKSNIKYTLLSDNSLQLSNQSKVGEVLDIDEDAVIQDLNSQKTIEVFKNFKLQTSNSKLLTSSLNLLHSSLFFYPCTFYHQLNGPFCQQPLYPLLSSYSFLSYQCGQAHPCLNHSYLK